MKREVLRIENVTLEQNGIIYLDNFSLHIADGEVVGMIGKNHHGIDELIQLICSNAFLKYGRVYLKETLVNTYLKETKRENRVFIIDQRSRLIPDLTVADNIFVLRKGFKKYVINQKALASQVLQTFDKLKIQIDPYLQVSELNQFERCVVELVKAALLGTNLIIIKEISEVLSSVELIRFYELIRYYSQSGIAFLYIANHHEEAFRICNRFVLVEDGRVVKLLFADELDDEHIAPYVHLIEEPKKIFMREDNVVLQFQDIRTGNLQHFSMQVSQGECLALLDCDNTALKDIVALASGRQEPQRGRVLLEGAQEKSRLREEVAVIMENPTENMLFQEMTYMENLCFLIDRKMNQSIIKTNYFKSIKREYEKELGQEMETSQLKMLSPQSLYNLVYYRILLFHPKVVFILQPFAGADMYLRSHIGKLINRLKKDSISVVLLTSQMTDILAVSDHLMIIKEGMPDAEHQDEKNKMIHDNYYGNRFFERKNH